MGEAIALPMDTAPRDGTMVRLLVEFAEHATEDCVGPAWTIGANNDDNVGDDERVGWQFAGWCWTHDHFTEGRGSPVGWLPLITEAAPVAGGTTMVAPREPTREHIEAYRRAEQKCIENDDDKMSPAYRGLEAVFRMIAAAGGEANHG